MTNKRYLELLIKILGFRHISYYLLLSALLIVSGTAKSQECEGSLGDPVITYDFGRGSAAFGPAIPDKTNYNYVIGQPADGSYTIIKTTQGMGHVNAGNWLSVGNHTPNQSNGYMMLINADDRQAGIFYQGEASGLCPGTTYEFAAWIINVMAKPGIRPNVRFSIESMTGQVLKEFDTGEIPEGSNIDWRRYAGTFRTTSSRVIVKIKNNGLGGGGNDFAIDDITFRACGPVIVPSINMERVSTKELCVLIKKTFTFSAEVSPGVYADPEYLWQQMAANGSWFDLPGQTTTNLTQTFDHPPIGSYKYRLLIAENGNINEENCRSNSPDYTINVVEPPVAVSLRAQAVCLGDVIVLDAQTNGATYQWTGPNSFASIEESPNIPNAGNNMSGRYTVVVTTSGGCIETEEIDLAVIPRPLTKINPITAICKGSSIQLQASGGLTYRWSPGTGLSQTDISNPIASPLQTTTYKVYASNGACEVPSEITVIVLKDALANAGPDKKMMKGEQVQLNAEATGDEIIYQWSPSTYLDNPNILNPVATPPSDITYTLTVTSTFGCIVSTDEVFVRVYQKVEIPSAFSPNGDGVNDLWKITAADMFPTASVKVLNRYGEVVFRSTNYDDKPWDGKYKNSDVPPGVYYYVINLNTSLKPLSGSLTVIR